MQTLLSKSTANAKLNKSIEYGWTSFGLHLAPYTLGGKNICPHASKGCATACLNTSGYGRYGKIQKARIKKTQYFHSNREEFIERLHKEISAKVKTSIRKNTKLSFRLNLTSDIPWECIKYKGKTLFDHFPDVQFMDYTKNPVRMTKFLGNVKWPKNYHLTFSRSESNDKHCDIVLASGGNVAVVFADKLPKTYKGKPVVDGDLHDLRFLDPKNVIVGLSAKGRGKHDTSGFVVQQ